MTGCGTVSDERLAPGERMFTDLLDGIKTFTAGFGKDQVIDITVSGHIVYYLAVKNGDADGNECTCGMFQITETAAFWAKSSEKSITLWKYDFAETNAEDAGIQFDADKPETVKCGIYEN